MDRFGDGERFSGHGGGDGLRPVHHNAFGRNRPEPLLDGEILYDRNRLVQFRLPAEEFLRRQYFSFILVGFHARGLCLYGDGDDRLRRRVDHRRVKNGEQRHDRIGGNRPAESFGQRLLRDRPRACRRRGDDS